MARQDPSHVRLCQRMSRSLIVDMNSRWSIAGMDVVEFPSDAYPAAQDYVRTQLARGVLEATDQAAFDSIDRLDLDATRNSGNDPGPIPHQEAKVVAYAEAARARIEEERFGVATSAGGYDPDFYAEQERRKALLDHQKVLAGHAPTVANVAAPEGSSGLDQVPAHGSADGDDDGQGTPEVNTDGTAVAAAATTGSTPTAEDASALAQAAAEADLAKGSKAKK